MAGRNDLACEVTNRGVGCVLPKPWIIMRVLRDITAQLVHQLEPWKD